MPSIEADLQTPTTSLFQHLIVWCTQHAVMLSLTQQEHKSWTLNATETVGCVGMSCNTWRQPTPQLASHTLIILTVAVTLALLVLGMLVVFMHGQASHKDNTVIHCHS